MPHTYAELRQMILDEPSLGVLKNVTDEMEKMGGEGFDANIGYFRNTLVNSGSTNIQHVQDAIGGIIYALEMAAHTRPENRSTFAEKEALARAYIASRSGGRRRKTKKRRVVRRKTRRSRR